MSNVRLQLLTRPNKRSGRMLKPGSISRVQGLVVINTTKHHWLVDRYTPKKK